MRDDTARTLVNRAQFDNSHETRDRIRERTPAVRATEHTIKSLCGNAISTPTRTSTQP